MCEWKDVKCEWKDSKGKSYLIRESRSETVCGGTSSNLM